MKNTFLVNDRVRYDDRLDGTVVGYDPHSSAIEVELDNGTTYYLSIGSLELIGRWQDHSEITPYQSSVIVDSVNEALIKAGVIKEAVEAGPFMLMALSDWADASVQQSNELHGADGWVANVKALLDGCPHTIRSCEGGGPENLLGSMVLTFAAMEHKLKQSEVLVDVLKAHIIR